DFELGQKIDHIFGPAIDLGVPLLPPEALDLGDGHAGHADFVQRILYLFELEGFDDRFDFFHGFTITAPVGLGPLRPTRLKWHPGHPHSSGTRAKPRHWIASPWIARSRPSRSISVSTRRPIVKSTSLRRMSEAMAS